jgi:hypothetical protein
LGKNKPPKHGGAGINDNTYQVTEKKQFLSFLGNKMKKNNETRNGMGA